MLSSDNGLLQVPGVQLNPEHPIDLHAATVAEAAAEEPANTLREALLSHTLLCILPACYQAMFCMYMSCISC